MSACALVLAAASTLRAESGTPLRLSIGLQALGRVEPQRPLERRTLELALHALPRFLVHEPPHSSRETFLRTDAPPVPEWLRLRALHDRVSLTLRPFANPAPLVPIIDTAPAILSPLFEPVRILSDLIEAQGNELTGHRMSVELGEHLEQRYTPLKGIAGDIQRGQYTRADDVTGRQLNVDVRVVIAWRPTDQIRLEAGYGVAYFQGGDSRADFGPTGPLTGDHTTNVLIHGPCAAVNFDF